MYSNAMRLLWMSIQTVYSQLKIDNLSQSMLDLGNFSEGIIISDSKISSNKLLLLLTSNSPRANGNSR